MAQEIMDMNLQMAKNQRYSKCVTIGDSTDRISNLPDEILAGILSCLPTKQAVATSILSKRWEHLWKLTSDVDFSDDSVSYCDVRGRTSFKEYVDRVLFHRGGSKIHKCHMFFRTKYVIPYIYAWICAVITCNLQQLLLDFLPRIGASAFHQLPWRLFTCSTLVVLQIRGSVILNVPTYVCFPCLKLLELTFVVFEDDASAERLFSSCPVLEELSIERTADSLQNMNIYIPSLKRLCIDSGNDNCHTNINTPYLEYLDILNGEPHRYSVNFTSSLVWVKLVDFDRVLLKGISQVQHFVLIVDGEMAYRIIHDPALPILTNLKKLELLWPITWRFLPNFLECSPNLEVLIFPHGLLNRGACSNRLYWERLQKMPGYLGLHLKTVEIYEFVGLREELKLVEFFMEGAKVLEKMIIHRSDFTRNPRMKEKIEGGRIMSEVLSFKRRSSTCEVIFTDYTKSIHSSPFIKKL